MAESEEKLKSHLPPVREEGENAGLKHHTQKTDHGTQSHRARVPSHARLSSTLQTAALHAPLSTGLSRQESWGGLPCPPPGGLPEPGLEPKAAYAFYIPGGFFATEPPEDPSGPVTSWQTEGEKAQAGTNLIFLGSKLTAGGPTAMEPNGAWSLEAK